MGNCQKKKDFLQDFGVDDVEEKAHEDDYDNNNNDDAYHDCEKDEIVKWFPLYEGDAMFPARESNIKRERWNKIEKLKPEILLNGTSDLNGFLRLRHPIAF